jgi:hypothetical protein
MSRKSEPTKRTRRSIGHRLGPHLGKFFLSDAACHNKVAFSIETEVIWLTGLDCWLPKSCRTLYR